MLLPILVKRTFAVFANVRDHHNIILRVLAATLGAYLSATAVSFALVPLLLFLGVSQRSDAVYFSVMLAYVAFFACVILCFSLATVQRVYVYLFSILLLSSLIHGASLL